MVKRATRHYDVCVIKINKTSLLTAGGIGFILLILVHVRLFISVHLTNEREWADATTDVEKYQSQGKAPWRKSKVLPQWMKDYFQWHQDSLKSLTADNVDDFDYLVYRCLEHDNKCGGGADRLKPLPLLLLMGSRLKRLVFYHWEKPAPLQEFLVPPPDGLDWRWPPHPSLANYTFSKEHHLTLHGIRAQLGITKGKGDESQQRLTKPLPKIETVRFQSTGHGMEEYNDLRENNESSYDDIFRDCWNSVFVPSPPIKKLIDEKMQEFHLRQDQYHAIHIRSLYHIEFGPVWQQNLTENAVNCLYSFLSKIKRPLKANTPIYLSTDSHNTTLQTIQYAHRMGLKRVLTREAINASHQILPKEPTLHLDRGHSFLDKTPEGWTRHDASRYYDTFVDLYLLSKARCIVVNVGSFGKWANLISSHPECWYSHMKDKGCAFPKDTFATTKN